MPPSPHMSQRTVPMKDNSEHRVKQLRGQRPPEKTYLVCHRQGRPDLGGLPQSEHPLPEKMGGHSPLEQEDGGGSAGDGLPTWEGCPSHHDPPDIQDPGGGVPGVGWALEGITAATRGGACSHRNLEFTSHQGSQCGTEPQHRQSPTCEASEVGQCPAGEGEDSSHQATPRGPGGSVESAVTPSKVGKGHKKPSKSGKSSTAEKTAIVPAAQKATASTSPAAQEATASTSPAAQEASASTSPAAQEATASTSPAAQEATTSTSPAAQEATASTSPAAQEATTSTSPAAQEATASISPAAQEATASTSPAGP
ncbi:hypothetical protein NDU88_007441 [Pleurodeles waltl]|uniref:Skin secretory protein xP2-like n=1 Tax=Pleurodeles waltl TaxID=8319 RepID=A0AAV7RV38_PLEWA|nr:hypothetical protein NDU88_007441 [Pleurodeles waltl]